MHRISWKDIDNGGDPSTWEWSELDEAVKNLPKTPNQQDLSLNLIEEPCDIAQNSAVMTWCDIAPPGDQIYCATPSCGPGTIRRAVPWDPILQTRRDIFLQRLPQHVIPATHHRVADEPLIPIIAPNLPGGDTGIRELDNLRFNNVDFPGYSRAALLGRVKDELDNVLLNFPGKQVQIGFSTVEDDLGGVPLWQYLYPKLRDRYNGVVKPKVHFFQEDLAASRASAAPDFIPYTYPPSTKAYTLYPNSPQLPSFAYYPTPDN